MSQIILDISANTHKNDWDYLKRMLDELKAVDTGKHEIIIKHQLFIDAGENIPLDHEIFRKAYCYAADLGYKTTSSVFDRESLEYLLRFNIPFVKIANNRSLDWLMGEVPRKIPVYVSKNENTLFDGELVPLAFYDGSNPDNCKYFKVLYCKSNYPATIDDYESGDYDYYYDGISDHTTNWDLYNKYKPNIYEVHYKLSDSTGLDAGDFARTPEQLSEIL